jgi:hypothetical protein
MQSLVRQIRIMRAYVSMRLYPAFGAARDFALSLCSHSQWCAVAIAPADCPSNCLAVDGHRGTTQATRCDYPGPWSCAWSACSASKATDTDQSSKPSAGRWRWLNRKISETPRDNDTIRRFQANVLKSTSEATTGAQFSIRCVCELLSP